MSRGGEVPQGGLYELLHRPALRECEGILLPGVRGQIHHRRHRRGHEPDRAHRSRFFVPSRADMTLFFSSPAAGARLTAMGSGEPWRHSSFAGGRGAHFHHVGEPDRRHAARGGEVPQGALSPMEERNCWAS